MADNAAEADGGGSTAPVFTMAMKFKLHWTLALAAAFSISHDVRAADGKPEPGLVVTFTAADGKTTDTTVAPQVALFVAAGQPPTPFLPGGKFTAVYEGTINADLRGSFLFQAEVSGALKLEINGAVALEAAGTGGASPFSKPVSLNKGVNALKATFTSPAKGDAFARLLWTEKGFNPGPIQQTLLAHPGSPALEKGTQLRLGRELLVEHRCANCHLEKFAADAMPELKMDAPSFEGIGARRNYDWMARWILDPKSLRPTAHMPKLLRGDNAKADAEAIAAYLAAQKAGGAVTPTPAVLQEKPIGENAEPANATPDEKKNLFEKLHCAGCHNAPGAKETDARKISFTRVAEKFAPGKLLEFLQKPEAHYAWIRMPNFKLSAAEARELADYLLAAAMKSKDAAPPSDQATLERGEKLVQTSGCLNCHGGLKLENKFQAPGLEALFTRHLKDRARPPEGDCLGKTPVAGYGFSAPETAALDAFTVEGASALSRHVPMEFAARQTAMLNCTQCHGQIENFPPLEILGGKLKPEWAGAFISGEVPRKMRNDFHPKGEPWLAARMPSFTARGQLLAAGLAAQHGFPPATPAEGPVDETLAKVGHKLTGKDGGLSCISCHGINAQRATEVFESEGINLGHTAARMQRSYFFRWMRLPASIDSQTKMPAFWDDSGKSPLTEILGGDSEKQIDAVWHYLRLGEKMPKPVVPE